jgi:hypothetical protein
VFLLLSQKYQEPTDTNASPDALETWVYTRGLGLTLLELYVQFLLDDPPMSTALTVQIMKVLAAPEEKCNTIRKLPEEGQKSHAAYVE